MCQELTLRGHSRTLPQPTNPSPERHRGVSIGWSSSGPKVRVVQRTLYWLKVVAVIAVVSVLLAMAIVYASEKAGALGSLAVLVILALPCAWVVTRAAAKKPG